MGIKTVVSLRSVYRDILPQDSTLQVVRIGSNPWHPEDEDMVKFLKIATDPNRQPVFVHCQRGVDRTGPVIAMYRMAVQGWTRDEAINEMISGGSLFDCVWLQNPKYLRRVDVAKIRRQTGLH